MDSCKLDFSFNRKTLLQFRDFNLPGFLTFTRPVGMRRVQMSCDICTRFARYLYSTKQSWIISSDICPRALSVPRSENCELEQISLGYSPVFGHVMCLDRTSDYNTRIFPSFTGAILSHLTRVHQSSTSENLRWIIKPHIQKKAPNMEKLPLNAMKHPPSMACITK